jgi:hypothetical protein
MYYALSQYLALSLSISIINFLMHSTIFGFFSWETISREAEKTTFAESTTIKEAMKIEGAMTEDMIEAMMTNDENMIMILRIHSN